MILPITSDTLIILNTYLSVFLIAAIVSISVEQALTLFKSLKND